MITVIFDSRGLKAVDHVPSSVHEGMIMSGVEEGVQCRFSCRSLPCEDVTVIAAALQVLSYTASA